MHLLINIQIFYLQHHTHANIKDTFWFLLWFSSMAGPVSGDTEAQYAGDTSSKRGGWITLPFMMGLCVFCFYFFEGKTATYVKCMWCSYIVRYVHNFFRMGTELDRLLDRGIQHQEHRCCSDFKHCQWMPQHVATCSSHFSWFFLWKHCRHLGFYFYLADC